MEVTVDNWKLGLEEVKKAVQGAGFISIDAEFTGLGSRSTVLANTAQCVYDGIRSDVNNYPVIQLGICAVHFDERLNEWLAKPFNFYVLPKSVHFPETAFNPLLERTFSFDASSIRFLQQHGFDFGKMFNSGVSYLNITDEAIIREKYTTKLKALRIPKHIKPEDKAYLDDFQKNVEEWMSGVKGSGTSADSEKPVFEFETSKSSVQRKLVYEFLESHDPQVSFVQDPFADSSSQSKIIRLKYHPDKGDSLGLTVSERKLLEELDCILSGFRGIRTLFDILIEAKLSLVVHNGFYDLCKVVSQFHCDLPESIKEWKTLVHGLFPCVIDTKRLARVLNDRVVQESLDKAGTGLADSVESLKKRLSATKTASMPVLRDEFGKYNDESSIHEAGYDAFLTAQLLLLMVAHDTNLPNPELAAVLHGSLKSNRFLSTFSNQLPVTRCLTTSWIDLSTEAEDISHFLNGGKVLHVTGDSCANNMRKVVSRLTSKSEASVRMTWSSSEPECHVFISRAKSSVDSNGNSNAHAIDDLVKSIVELCATHQWACKSLDPTDFHQNRQDHLHSKKRRLTDSPT